MLRNIGLLFLIVIGSQVLIIVVMQITGLQYRVAGLLTFAVVLIALFGALVWLSIRAVRARNKLSAELSRSQRSMEEIRGQISGLREAVEKINDPQKRAEALVDLELLEKGSRQGLSDEMKSGMN